MCVWKKVMLIIAVSVLIVSFMGCESKNRSSSGSNRVNIVASIFPAYDFARAIAGENADITMLINPGASVHSYDPSPSDMKKISEADIFIYNGGESDAWIERLLSGTEVSGIKIVRLMDSVDAVEENAAGVMEAEEEEGHGEHSSEHTYDEHIWTSPKNAVKLVSAIAEAMCETDAEKSDTYRQNAEAYIEAIQEIDKDIRNIVENGGNNMIVVADKFPFIYFTNEYGLSYRAAFAGCSDQSDASAATIAELVNTVKENGLPYIYYVELSSGNVSNAVASETGAGQLLLHSCQNVSKQEFEAGETYVSLMKKNAENLKRGLD